MVIEVLGEEELIPLPEAGRMVAARTGVKVGKNALIGWRDRGIRGVKLECSKVGHRWYTTREALEEFFAQSTKAALGEEIAITPPKPTKAAVQAGEALARLGIGGAKRRRKGDG